MPLPILLDFALDFHALISLRLLLLFVGCAAAAAPFTPRRDARRVRHMRVAVMLRVTR